MKRSVTLLTLAALLLVSAAPNLRPKASPRVDDSESRRWYVYRDAIYSGNHGEWTNFMTVREADPGRMISLSMVDKSNPFTGLTAIKVGVEFLHPWAGIAVSSMPDYWGKTPGKSFDLTKAEKLVFYAKGEKGGEAIRVKVGVTGSEKFGDSMKFPAESELIQLTNKWTRYEISLKSYDLKRVITPFVVVTERVYNESNKITFFLDDIYFACSEDVVKTSPVSQTSASRTSEPSFFSYIKSRNPDPSLVAFTPTNYDPRPEARRIPSSESLRADLESLRQAFDGLILYGYDKDLTPTLLAESARQGYRAAVLGIWDPRSDSEIAGVVAMVKEYGKRLALAVCVGNEGIAFNRYTFNDLKVAAEKLQRQLGGQAPICTSEPISQYGQARLREFGDFLAPNIHPVFDKPELSPSEAVLWVRERAESLAEVANKSVMVKETGFPHGGDDRFTPESQKAFWAQYAGRSRLIHPAKQSRLWVSFAAAFEAFDLPWKAAQSKMEIEQFWGLMTNPDRKPLPVFYVWRDLLRPSNSKGDRVASAYRYLETGMDRATRGTIVYQNQGDGLACFFPSNRMGDFAEIDLDDGYEVSPGDTCIKISYDASSAKKTGKGWAGAYWTYPNQEQGNWGDLKGRSVAGATKLRFRARGEMGSEIVEFLVGGINRDPHRDLSQPKPYQDKFDPEKIRVELSRDWAEYEIPLPEGTPLDSVIGGFGCAISVIYNPGQCVFYLDDISFDDANPDLLRLIRSYTPADDRESRIRFDEEPLTKLKVDKAISGNVKDYESIVRAIDKIMSQRPQDDWWYENEKKFIEALRKEIGNEQTKKYERLILKYASREDWVLRNSSFVYDISLAIMAFLARGDGDALRRARILADSLCWAQSNDRAYKDGRWRNAYSSGPLEDPADKQARLPGWYHIDRWYEDRYAVSSDVGNAAWAMLALLAAHRVLEAGWKDSPYLQAAIKAARWITVNYKMNDALGGFRGGFDGWEASKDSIELTWRSSEHNIDIYAAMLQLARASGDRKWEEEALHARKFFLDMWARKDHSSGKGSSSDSGFFWTGTKPKDDMNRKVIINCEADINCKVIPLDVQVWAVLSMGHDEEFRKVIGWQGPPSIPSCVEWVENICSLQESPKCPNISGYKFSAQGTEIWFEGMAQLSATYYYLGDSARAQTLLDDIARANPGDSAAGIKAACGEAAWTGFHKKFGRKVANKEVDEKWKYPARAHVGATAWFLLASHGVNPYWLGMTPIKPGASR